MNKNQKKSFVIILSILYTLGLLACYNAFYHTKTKISINTVRK